ncbi:hypothetical protein OD91_0926 [Lutibacter sp. Hel_I_33_5]|uniref:hypothetical protein n=1 Tax=Lutibacter sp. Hel_I_33_5 TaxID=1566289 RepID=UPI0011A3614F|nr:hypothetical protein [Lutibacter sp. Hel_I_33_5]TVZ55667.1 hypothetical protein OD91_0926 [Lutibacter sp. Hel_I_33_5]
MGYFWATFSKKNDNYYRFDTRVYFDTIDKIDDNDICIGAVVGKNPGSALPENLILDTPCKINLSGDKLLPTLRNILKKANPSLGGRQYVQVLNLFYLCNPNLSEAISDYKKEDISKIEITCGKEQSSFNWLWFLWGGNDNQLNDMKNRFKTVKATKYFYLNNNDKKMYSDFPQNNVCAKHTQGMTQDLVIPYLKTLSKIPCKIN